MNILCTICSDFVNQAENIYVTKCGHIFHHHCLAQWIERSKSCPQCRNKVTERCMFRLYPTVSNETSADDAATLQSRLDDAQLQLRQQKATSKEKDDTINKLNEDLKKNLDLIKSYEKKLMISQSAAAALKEQLEYVKIQNLETNRLKEENDMLQKNIQTLNGLQKVLNATTEDVENMLRNYADVRTIAVFATALKRALCECESKKNEYRDKLHSTKQQLSAERSLVTSLQGNIMQLNERIATAMRKYEALKNKRKAPETVESTNNESNKQPRLNNSFELNTGILDDSATKLAMQDISDNNMSSLVHRIENADSPYLNLKQSSVALSLSLQRTYSIPDNGIKPSELAIINSARNHALKPIDNNPLSIFHKKQPLQPDPSHPPPMDMYYDGMGGHSKLDTFPTPKRPELKKYIPKISAKHKLKRPAAPTGSQDIGKLFQKMSQ